MPPRSFLIATSGHVHEAVYLHFHALARELSSRGHRAALILDGRPEWLKISDNGPEHFFFPAAWPGKLKNIPFLVNLIRSRRADTLIANYDAVPQAMIVSECLGVPNRIAWYRSVRSQWTADDPKPEWVDTLLAARRRIIYARATHLAAISEGAKRDAAKYYCVPEHKITVFYNSMEDPGQPKKPEPGTFLCAGRLVPSKGHELALRAFAALAPKYSSIRLHVAGSGQLDQELRSLASELGIAERCRFTGILPRKEFLSEMSRAYGVIIPSLYDALPKICTEAFAAGAAMIASSHEVFPEVIADGQDGLIFRSGDSADLAAKMEKLINDPALRENLSRGAKKKFLESFEQRRIVSAQADWLERMGSGTRLKPVPSRPDIRVGSETPQT